MRTDTKPQRNRIFCISESQPKSRVLKPVLRLTMVCSKTTEMIKVNCGWKIKLYVEILDVVIQVQLKL